MTAKGNFKELDEMHEGSEYNYKRHLLMKKLGREPKDHVCLRCMKAKRRASLRRSERRSQLVGV